jgi:hypothetical protein
MIISIEAQKARGKIQIFHDKSSEETGNVSQHNRGCV